MGQKLSNMMKANKSNDANSSNNTNGSNSGGNSHHSSTLLGDEGLVGNNASSPTDASCTVNHPTSNNTTSHSNSTVSYDHNNGLFDIELLPHQHTHFCERKVCNNIKFVFITVTTVTQYNVRKEFVLLRENYKS